ncbi:MAG: hypothetical protein ACT4O5_01040 [Gammaproteobacteria bacterium]
MAKVTFVSAGRRPYLKRQLQQRGLAFEAWDNGIRSCEDPKRLQRLAQTLSAEKIDALLRKWLKRLPHLFTSKDRQAGYRYQLSILQAEFSHTQVLDQAVNGRVFFEEVIRENLDLGRPDQVQLIFQRRLTRRTPGRFRTRVITAGVVPSLYVDYKKTRIKQYHKEGRALRTETTINNTYDFDVGRSLKNLPQLKTLGFAANRRLLEMQRITHDCTLGGNRFQKLQKPLWFATLNERPRCASGTRACWRFCQPWSSFVCCPRLPSRSAAPALCGSPGARPHRPHSRANDLSAATAPFAWSHRASFAITPPSAD